MANLASLVERVRRRGGWWVEPSDDGNAHRVRSACHGILADGLSRLAAERLAAAFNAVADDARSLSEGVRGADDPLGGTRLRLVTYT